MALTASISRSNCTASAATLDFSGIQGSNIGTAYAPGIGGSGATINHINPAGNIFVGAGAAGESDGFCFVGSSSCAADGEMIFDSAVMNLTFDVDGAQFGDSVVISAYNGATSVSYTHLTLPTIYSV